MAKNDLLLDDEGKKNFFGQIHKLWIEPEINKRRQAGTLPEGFKIFRCLIKLPKNNLPIVELNDEIRWVAMAKPARESLLLPGQIVFIHEIEQIVDVQPPEVDGQRVAFIYLFWDGYFYNTTFDFSPNWPKESIGSDEADEWRLGKIIAQSLQALLTEKAIVIHDETQGLFQKIGLWLPLHFCRIP